MRKLAYFISATAVAMALVVSAAPVAAQSYGPGMMGGYGQCGMMGQGMMGGYGQSPMMGGCGMMGPGMMGQQGMMSGGQGMTGGQGMMGHNMMGYGPGYYYGGQANLNLTADTVKSYLGRMIAIQGNPRLKVGDVKEKDADTIVADIVTKENSLVQRFNVDRRTGFYRPEESQ